MSGYRNAKPLRVGRTLPGPSRDNLFVPTSPPRLIPPDRNQQSLFFAPYTCGIYAAQISVFRNPPRNVPARVFPADRPGRYATPISHTAPCTRARRPTARGSVPGSSRVPRRGDFRKARARKQGYRSPRDITRSRRASNTATRVWLPRALASLDIQGKLRQNS